jgi:hypothetical protein
MEILTLEELRDTAKLLSYVQCDFFSENCIVALEHNNHSPGCELRLIGDIVTTNFKLKWGRKIIKSGYKERKKFIEHGAEALSFFLAKKITEYSIIEEAEIGTTVDYWLGYDVEHILYDPKNFIQARLEISGINKEKASNTLEKRVREKKEQIKSSKRVKLPAYVSVIAFSSLKAFFGKK